MTPLSDDALSPELLALKQTYVEAVSEQKRLLLASAKSGFLSFVLVFAVLFLVWPPALFWLLGSLLISASVLLKRRRLRELRSLRDQVEGRLRAERIVIAEDVNEGVRIYHLNVSSEAG